jgi:hypothetical protein
MLGGERSTQVWIQGYIGAIWRTGIQIARAGVIVMQQGGIKVTTVFAPSTQNRESSVLLASTVHCLTNRGLRVHFRKRSTSLTKQVYRFLKQLYNSDMNLRLTLIDLQNRKSANEVYQFVS